MRILVLSAVVLNLTACAGQYAPRWQPPLPPSDSGCVLEGPDTTTVVIRGPAAAARCQTLLRGAYRAVDAIENAAIPLCRFVDRDGDVVVVLNHWDTITSLSVCSDLQN